MVRATVVTIVAVAAVLALAATGAPSARNNAFKNVQYQAAIGKFRQLDTKNNVGAQSPYSMSHIFSLLADKTRAIKNLVSSKMYSKSKSTLKTVETIPLSRFKAEIAKRIKISSQFGTDFASKIVDSAEDNGEKIVVSKKEGTNLKQARFPIEVNGIAPDGPSEKLENKKQARFEFVPIGIEPDISNKMKSSEFDVNDVAAKAHQRKRVEDGILGNGIFPHELLVKSANKKQGRFIFGENTGIEPPDISMERKATKTVAKSNKAAKAGKRDVAVQRAVRNRFHTTVLPFKVDKRAAPKQQPWRRPGLKTAPKPEARKPVAKKTAAGKPVAKKPAAKEPADKKAVAKKPVTKGPGAKKPIAKKPEAKKPAAKKPAAKEPADKKAVAKKPLAKGPGAKKPIAKKPEAKKPAAKKTSSKDKNC